MSARASSHIDGPTHCISRALAAPRSQAVQPDLERCQLPVLQRKGYCWSLGNVDAVYWQERLTDSALFLHKIC